MNETLKKPLPQWLPFALGLVLVVQFAGLGAWQVSRGLEKRSEQELYDAAAAFTPYSPGMEVRPYQRLAARGAFDTERQVLLDNIILNGRYGHYVITPLVIGDDAPVLLVNRGWIEARDEGTAGQALEVPAGEIEVRGRAGSLPRAGYKMGEAFGDGSDWPRHAVYPTREEVAVELGSEVLPFVLLMEPGDDGGFLRFWEPEEMGPGRHFAYALQWFAMGAVLALLLAWHFRRRRGGHD